MNQMETTKSMYEILEEAGIKVPGLQEADVKVPTEPFYEFYAEGVASGRFKTPRDIVATPEWEQIYSQFFDFDDYELDIDLTLTESEIENKGDPDHPDYDPRWVQREIIKCATSFSYFCHRFVKILHPVFGILPCIIYKFQKRCIENYEAHRFNILSKCRQGGLTTTGVLWGLWRCMFRTNQQILLLSKTDREALSAGEVAKRGIEKLPAWLKPDLAEDSKHEKHFAETDSALKFYTPEAARGKSVTILIIDEAAFIPDMQTHWKAMYPVISTGGSCVVISTVNGVGNWYEEIYHEAEAGENDFNVIEIDYWEHPDYCDPEWAKKTYANLGERGWDQEVLRSFLGSGETYIPTRIIISMEKFAKDMEPLRCAFEEWKPIVGERKRRQARWDAGALWIWKEPIDGHEYIIGVDCAEGVGADGDYNCFQVLDAANLEQVAEFYSNTVPPNVFAQIVYQIGIYYNMALVAVENNGVGGAVASNLQYDLAYENLYYEAKKAKSGKSGVQITAPNRPVYLESMQHRIVNGTVRINSLRLVQELKTFIFDAKKKRAEARKGEHDDAIMALCIALVVREDRMRDIPIGADVPEQITQVFDSDTFKKIREEILNESPEDWLEEDVEDPILIPEREDNLLEAFGFRRKHEKLLKEFGWMINWFFLGGSLIYTMSQMLC